MVLGAALGVPADALRAQSKALNYDSSGRVIGVHGSDVDGKSRGRTGSEAHPSVRGGTGGVPGNLYRRGEVLVVDPPRGFLPALRRLGFSVIEHAPLRALQLDLYLIRIPDGMAEYQALSRLRQRFPGIVADVNQLFEPSAGSAGAAGSGRPAGPRAACGAGMTLGMIDAAVDVTHPALRGQRVEYRSFHDRGRQPGPASHGTAIAAMLVGRTAEGWGGLVPGARLKAANIFQQEEGGSAVGSANALFKAIDWMAESGVTVLNLSIAGSDNRVTRLVFRRGHAKGIVMVAAAGNWGAGAQPAYPAAYSEVVAVTAVGAGRSVYRHANQGSYIDFAAPGVGVWTAVPGGGRYQSGTSFAAPYVSALMALEVGRGIMRSAAALRAALRRNAIDLGDPGRDEIYGWGYVEMPRPCLNWPS